MHGTIGQSKELTVVDGLLSFAHLKEQDQKETDILSEMCMLGEAGIPYMKYGKESLETFE